MADRISLKWLQALGWVVRQVIDCGDWCVAMMKQAQFFKLYEKNAVEEDMLKLKDWPPNAHFRERLGRHNQVGPPKTGAH